MLTTEVESKTTVAPFGVEADTPRNSDILLQSIPGCRLRGTISATKSVTDFATGELRVPIDQVRCLGLLPTLPGQQIHANPAKLTYQIVDPMFEDEALCERLRKAMQSAGFNVADKLTGVPLQRGTLDVHRMKTLCRELLWLVEAGEAKLVKGVLPKMEDVEVLPGNYLLNPGSQIPNQQPRFERDWDKWLENLTRSGG